MNDAASGDHKGQARTQRCQIFVAGLHGAACARVPRTIRCLTKRNLLQPRLLVIACNDLGLVCQTDHHAYVGELSPMFHSHGQSTAPCPIQAAVQCSTVPRPFLECSQPVLHCQSALDGTSTRRRQSFECPAVGVCECACGGEGHTHTTTVFKASVATNSHVVVGECRYAPTQSQTCGWASWKPFAVRYSVHGQQSNNSDKAYTPYQRGHHEHCVYTACLTWQCGSTACQLRDGIVASNCTEYNECLILIVGPFHISMTSSQVSAYSDHRRTSTTECTANGISVPLCCTCTARAKATPTTPILILRVSEPSDSSCRLRLKRCRCFRPRGESDRAFVQEVERRWGACQGRLARHAHVDERRSAPWQSASRR